MRQLRLAPRPSGRQLRLAGQSLRQRRPAPGRTWVVVASAGMLAALATTLMPHRPTVIAILLAAAGVVTAVVQITPAAVRLVLARRSIIAVVILGCLVVAWVVVGLTVAHRSLISPTMRNGQPMPAYGLLGGFIQSTSWPWRVDGVSLLALLLNVLCAGGGFVLVADAVRVQLGLARPPRSLWRSITATPSKGGRTAARAIPGTVLIGLSTFLSLSLVSQYYGYGPDLASGSIDGGGGVGFGPYGSSHLVWQTLAFATVCALNLALLVGPVAVGLALGLDVDKEGRAREEERRRFAAHLHDSVLQTLALIQRQATDPDTVAKLARRQESALRAWMAGETDLSSATLATSLREMIEEVEDELSLKVEVTTIGDAPLDARSEEMVAAAREVLRNAARHAPGAPVNIFLDIGAAGTELFIRDSGPGFEFAAVPPERRGLRDAVLGRMSLAGGSATVESTPGEGTEVALRLSGNKNRRAR